MDKTRISKYKILLFKGRGFFSRLIRWKTKSRFSHAAVLYPDGKTIVESWQGAGVRKKELKDFEDTEGFLIYMTREQEIGFVKFLESKIGYGYNYLGILGFIVNKSLYSKNKYFCSELIYDALCHVGIVPLNRTKGYECPPDLLYRSHKLIHEIPF